MASIEEFKSALRRHVVDAWFPHSIDKENGGFFCDFDRQWRSAGPHDKLLEFQARHTLFAADAARYFPENADLRKAAHHGFRFLRDVLWDREFGGWYHSVDRAGEPIEHHTKHTHGFAYALSACASYYDLTGDGEAQRLANDAFEWMEQYARDREYGGYFGFLLRDGSVVSNRSMSPYPHDMDTVGTEIGFKDLNVHSDLLETFALMFRTWRDPRIGDRLSEAVEIVAERMINPTTGSMHFFVTSDWRPVPHLIRVGYQSHSAYRLLLALGLTSHDALIRRIAPRIMDSAVRYARADSAEGYYYAAPGAFPVVLHDHRIQAQRRVWWVQMEALKGLLAVSRIVPDPAPYLQLFEEQWRFIQKRFLDERFGGMYMYGLESARVWQRKFGARFAPRFLTRKGDVWKDASHEGRALLYCIETLGTPPD